jgi:photosystem II stability/assembly factor-like uncharacterized protein
MLNPDGSVLPDKAEKKTPGTHPGYAEQWRLMKGLDSGTWLPSGLYRQWAMADKAAQYKKPWATGLWNVRELGPSNIGGRTRDMLIDLADPDRLLACGVSGGIWESKNGGGSWKAINDRAATLSATCITQDPFNHQVLYYGTGEPTGNSAGISGEGIFKSVDGGKTFEQIDNEQNRNFGGIWDIKHSLSDSHTVYVATANQGMWKTVNGGDSFYKVFTFGSHIHDIEVRADGAVFIGVEAKGVYYSATGETNTFELLGQGMPASGFNRLDIALSTAHPQVMYALFAKGTSGYGGEAVGVWKSGNGGKTWQLMGNPQTGTGESFGFPWYCLALGVDPTDTNKLVAGSAGYAYSTNGGTTWMRARDAHADYHCFAFRPDVSGSFYAGNDGGIYLYNWSTIANSYDDKNSGYNVTQVYAGSFTPDSNGVLIGSQDNWTTYSAAGQGTFRQVYGGDGAFCHVHQQNPDIAYLSSQNGNLRKTGGLNYSSPSTIGVMGGMDADNNNSIDDGAWFINPFEMNYLNGDMLFFPTRRRLWWSYDGAQTWEAITNYKSNLYAVGIPNAAAPGRVYVGGDNLQLYRIDNLYGAAAGEEVSIGRTGPMGISSSFVACIAVHPRTDKTLYLALSNLNNAGRVWRVDSAHLAVPVWTDISGDLPKGLPANWIVADPYQPDQYLAVGTDFGLYVTQNGGQTWAKEERIPNVSIHNMRLRYSDRTLFVYTHGRGVFVAKLPRMEDPYVGVAAGQEGGGVGVYPNPSGGVVRLSGLPAGSYGYRVVDGAGREVAKGLTTGDMDLGRLPKGSYLLELSGQGGRWVHKVELR